MQEDVTAAELGELLGITARAVADLGKRGIAVKAGPNRYRLKESVSRYCDDLRRQAKGKGGEGAAAERGRLASAQANLVELRTKRQAGELLDAREVEREWSSILTMVRSRCLAIPSRVASRLPHLPRGDVAEVDYEVRAVLTELASQKTGGTNG